MTSYRVNIDGRELNAYPGQTILEVAKGYDIDIPTLCHDDRLEPYGSCGLCVVEVEGTPKLLRACSTAIQEGMIIRTWSNRIEASRRTTLELLLTDHTGDCKAPCSLGCPSQVDVQGYVGLIANREYSEALQLIKEELPLPASIGRVCPHPCQTACRRGQVEESLSIAWLKRYVADMDLEKDTPYMPQIAPSTGKRIAIIGGGPSGLTAAYYLRKAGHEVAVYEAMPTFGGMLQYGIPLYRLPKDVLQQEVKLIERMGVKLIPNIRIGVDMSLDHIRSRFDGVYVAIGAWKSATLPCPGSELTGVFGGIEFLNKFAINDPIRVGERIAVIGGGNTAMDACRTAIRLGAKEVYAIYRRTKEDMPAVDVEIEEAIEEGVTFKFLKNPVEILDDGSGQVSAIRLQQMEVKPGNTGERSRVKPVEGAYETLEVDSVIVSIGQRLDIGNLDDLQVNAGGNIEADTGTFMTNLPGVFAGGDCTNGGADIAIQAIAEGKQAARVMDKWLRGQVIPYEKPFTVRQKSLPTTYFTGIERLEAAHMSHESPELRKHTFEEIVHGFTPAEANQEANRCLECGCGDVHECSLLQHAQLHKVMPERIGGESPDRPVQEDHPFLLQDTNKCILCGMCVRMCDQRMDNGALGLVGRGFETVVQPAFGDPLRFSHCISCGQCIDVCPTGALQEKLPIAKSVPLIGERTQTVCSHCGLGCGLELETKGSLLLRAHPVLNDPVSGGLLCSKGRFGFDVVEKETRLKQPLLRKAGLLEPVAYTEAFLHIARKAQSLQLLYGTESVGITVSDRYTNEEVYMIKQLAKTILGTEDVYSFGASSAGVGDVAGVDASLNTLEEVSGTDFVLLVGDDPIDDQTIAGLKLRDAYAGGTVIMQVGGTENADSPWEQTEDTFTAQDLLEQMVSALLHEELDGVVVEGLDKLRERLNGVVVTREALELLVQYKRAKKAMIVLNTQKISRYAGQLATVLAVLTGHVGKPRDGLVVLRGGANTQGLIDLGVHTQTDELKERIRKGSVKGLLVFGENIAPEIVEGLDLLVVQDTHVTALANAAHVVLPAATLSETEGTVTNGDRRVQFVRSAVAPHPEQQNWEMIKGLMNTFHDDCMIQGVEQIRQAISKEVEGYAGMGQLPETGDRWPIGQMPVLCSENFYTQTGKANVDIARTEPGPVFLTNHMTTCFVRRLEEATG